jgi:hypothetical protein
VIQNGKSWKSWNHENMENGNIAQNIARIKIELP